MVQAPVYCRVSTVEFLVMIIDAEPDRIDPPGAGFRTGYCTGHTYLHRYKARAGILMPVRLFPPCLPGRMTTTGASARESIRRFEGQKASGFFPAPPGRDRNWRPWPGSSWLSSPCRPGGFYARRNGQTPQNHPRNRPTHCTRPETQAGKPDRSLHLLHGWPQRPRFQGSEWRDKGRRKPPEDLPNSPRPSRMSTTLRCLLTKGTSSSTR